MEDAGAADDVLAAVEIAAVEHFGHAPDRASLTLVGVDPITVLRFTAAPRQLAYLTLGMSRAPMTGADQLVPDADGPRAELLVEVDAAIGGGLGYPEVWRALAMLAAAPVVDGLVYVPGATVDTGAALSPGSRCTGVVVAEAFESPLPSVPTPVGPVAVLTVLPATAAELAWARSRGATELRRRWREEGTDLADLGRAAVALD